MLNLIQSQIVITIHGTHENIIHVSFFQSAISTKSCDFESVQWGDLAAKSNILYFTK